MPAALGLLCREFSRRWPSDSGRAARVRIHAGRRSGGRTPVSTLSSISSLHPLPLCRAMEKSGGGEKEHDQLGILSSTRAGDVKRTGFTHTRAWGRSYDRRSYVSREREIGKNRGRSVFDERAREFCTGILEQNDETRNEGTLRRSIPPRCRCGGNSKLIWALRVKLSGGSRYTRNITSVGYRSAYNWKCENRGWCMILRDRPRKGTWIIDSCVTFAAFRETIVWKESG